MNITITFRQLLMIVTVIVIFFMKDGLFMYVVEFIRLNNKQFYRNYYKSTAKISISPSNSIANGCNRKILQYGLK